MPTPKRKRRPCPRGLYNGCPIPRELCTGGHARTGRWPCLDLLAELEWFVFEGEASDRSQEAEPLEAAGVETLEDLMAALKKMDGPGLN